MQPERFKAVVDPATLHILRINLKSLKFAIDISTVRCVPIGARPTERKNRRQNNQTEWFIVYERNLFLSIILLRRPFPTLTNDDGIKEAAYHMQHQLFRISHEYKQTADLELTSLRHTSFQSRNCIQNARKCDKMDFHFTGSQYNFPFANAKNVENHKR